MSKKTKKPKIKRDKDGKKEIEEITNRKGRLEITHRRVKAAVTLESLQAQIDALRAEVAALKKIVEKMSKSKRNQNKILH